MFALQLLVLLTATTTLLLHVECAAQVNGDVRTTFAFDHSRRTHEVREEEADEVTRLLNVIQDQSAPTAPRQHSNLAPHREEPVGAVLHAYGSTFAHSANDQIRREQNTATTTKPLSSSSAIPSLDDTSKTPSGNVFSKIEYDPDYRIHDLCDAESSGSQSNDGLVWSESADRLLKVIGNGVVRDGYNMFMAPGQTKGKLTTVYVAVYFESMSSFKAQTMDFELDLYLALGWFDRRLAHNCTHPILVTNKLIADRIWSPDLYFVNSKFAYLQEVTTPNFMMIVYPDGLIFKSMRIDVTLSCMMDLQRFPMDRQECPIIIQSYAYISNILNLTWHRDEEQNFPMGHNAEIKLNDMEILGQRTEPCSSPYPMYRGPTAYWSCLKAVIVMRRLVLFHVIQTYIPTGMLVIISWMSFWLDPRASPARISLTITSLLTLTTMSNGARQDLPQVSYIKALDIWLTFSQALIFLVLLEYSFVSYYVTKRTFECEHRSHIQLGSSSNMDDGPNQKGGEGHNTLLTGNNKNNNNNGGSNAIPRPSIVVTNADEDLLTKFRNGEEVPFEKLPFMRAASPVLERRHTLKPKKSASAGSGSPFSLKTGLSQCMNASAALMSATPQAASQFFQKMDVTKPCQRCMLLNEQIARSIDKYSRTIFPIVFCIFCASYWSYYSYFSPDE